MSPRHVWFWSLMVNMVMDSLYVMLSGIAKDDLDVRVKPRTPKPMRTENTLR